MTKDLTMLIESNEKLIFSLLKDYNNYIDKEDLYQVGVIGLINAYNNFKQEKGVKFSTYAYIYIKGEINKYLRENRAFKINKDTSTLYNKIKHTKTLLEQKLMREPTIKELSEFLEISEYKISVILGIQNNVQSFDVPIKDNGKVITLYDVIPDNNHIDTIDKICLKEEFSKLSYEDKRLLQERYFNDRSQSEVADILGLSQVKVSRTEKKVLQKLRNNMVA